MTRDPLAPPAPVWSSTAGAILDFYGVVRGLEGENAIAGLEYESYLAMAESQLRKIAEETLIHFALEDVTLIHRVGFVAAGEPSLFLRVTAGHREEAFAGSREIIERLKREVPIWKNPIQSQAL
ncbi:MAG: molybdenum cofactor biosynthesis protein MoaE [Chthoniobacterales bacterium]